MLPTKEVRRIAAARLQDAGALHAAERYDGAVYLCGYAVELALKARICRTLKWSGYPLTNAEFAGLSSFKVHDLELLLKLTGRAALVKAHHLVEWSVVLTWKPEDRYKEIGSAGHEQSRSMLNAQRRRCSS